MTRLCDASRSALLVIDLQQRLMPAIADGETTVNNALVLARAARLLQVPVIGTEQYPQGLGSSLPEVAALLDLTVSKLDFDASADPALLAALPVAREQLLVTGCEAHVCVLQTVLGLVERGYQPRVVIDAVGSRRPASKAAALERMRAAGVPLLTAEMVVFEWMRSSRHPRFKELLALIK